MIDLFTGLNDEQKRAVKTIDGPLLIQAGAGSGKTKTLTHRIAYILSKEDVRPYNILAVTFTNKAAKELRERLAKLLGFDKNDRSFIPFIGTFHSICVRLLRISGEHVNIPKNFIIFDETDRLSAIKQIFRELHIDEKQYPSRQIAQIIGSAKNEMVTPEEFYSTASSPLQKVAAKVYPLYEKSLKEAGALDFDDLINKTVNMLSVSSEVRKDWQNKFHYIMIDEYQDTNSAQYKLIKLLVNKDQNIGVVGDDWQSIYSWRGADFTNILRFEKDYPKATVIKLEQNYRSTKNILDAAHKIINKNTKRSTKKLWTAIGDGLPVQIISVANERAESETVARRIMRAVDAKTRKYSDFAILYRTNAQSRAVEEACLHMNLPYKIFGGQRFYDRKEIKDVVAYLRLIYQPEDKVSFERIVNVPARGIGKTSLNKFFAWQIKNNYSLSQALTNANECEDITKRAKDALSELSSILTDIRSLSSETNAAGLIDMLLRRIDYIDYLEDSTPQSEMRVENVRELLSVAREYQDSGLDDFLEEVALVSDLDNAKVGQDYVTLMTLHSAKGLEFPVVFIVGLEESLLPHSRSLYDASEMEEERRLCYVGMTRAREELYLTHAMQRILYGGMQHNPPSRFLSDIDGEQASEQVQFKPMPAEDEPHYVLELSEGDRVEHNVFGMGTVMEMDGDMAVIYFKGRGAKKINVAFAPLIKAETT